MTGCNKPTPDIAASARTLVTVIIISLSRCSHGDSGHRTPSQTDFSGAPASSASPCVKSEMQASTRLRVRVSAPLEIGRAHV